MRTPEVVFPTDSAAVPNRSGTLFSLSIHTAVTPTYDIMLRHPSSMPLMAAVVGATSLDVSSPMPPHPHPFRFRMRNRCCVSRPRRTRGATQRNLSNMCYVKSCLHQLFMMEPMRNGLLSLDEGDTEVRLERRTTCGCGPCSFIGRVDIG